MDSINKVLSLFQSLKVIVNIVVVFSFLLLLNSCASPAIGISPDAWAYKAYPGPKKHYSKLSNVIVRNAYARKRVLHKVIIRNIDDDDGGEYSNWNASWGGNESSLGYLKMWIEPGLKNISVLFRHGIPFSMNDTYMSLDNAYHVDDHIQFNLRYKFEPGYEYKLYCTIDRTSGLDEEFFLTAEALNFYKDKESGLIKLIRYSEKGELVFIDNKSSEVFEIDIPPEKFILERENISEEINKLNDILLKYVNCSFEEKEHQP